MKSDIIRINTSNAGKLREYRRLFNRYGIRLEISQHDLSEIDADPLTVAVQKASQVDEGVLVEDTSLDVEGVTMGVNIRWLIDALSQYVNAKATWTVFLAYRSAETVYVCKGDVNGVIVPARNHGGFGFDPYFLPDGCLKTLGEEKPDSVNARALAVQAFVKNDFYATKSMIDHWDGKWQNSVTS